MPAPQIIRDLVERFETHRDSYCSPAYNETQVRREFIDPFFKALGWDVNNEHGYAEQWKEVIHEDAIKIGGLTKAPDYSFRLGGRRVFFLEAKRPAINLRDDPGPAFQLRRYAWTARLPLSILTDFEEFIVYDTRIQPAITDKPSKARILSIHYTEYLSRWDEIACIFSPDSIHKGAFDKYVESATRKRGTAAVDDTFLAEIEDWREQFARNIALRNRGLTQRELNTSVQSIIDRIIFLRICEDRGIEDYGRLQALLNGADVYARLRELFASADERYNSGLFHFRAERDRLGHPDELTPRLTIDDKVLKDIFRRLYYPECPYEFSVLPVEILGQVYERFLGSVIRLTEGGRAKVEQKPEVRKAGGVYYTPDYIVDYIVKNTIGPLLEGNTPQDVAGLTNSWRPSKGRRSLAILDPACGSGSFLLGAFQYLLDWHLEQYEKDAEIHSKGKSPRIHQHHRGGWRLTTSERKRILLANIHGVDIDAQAVEVTKLSLLLKVLEGENAETLQKQFALFHERALPDLGLNIKCGNSLIGPDFFKNRQSGMFDEEEMFRINPFDWNAEYPEIMATGGFDAVIGNPPYVRIQTMREWAPAEVEYYKRNYKAAGSGNYDLYVVFVEKGLGLLNRQGRLGYILPNKFFNANYGMALRSIIAEGRYLSHVVHFGSNQVFRGATTYTCLLFLDSAGSSECRFDKIDSLADWRLKALSPTRQMQAVEISSAPWNFSIGPGSDLFRRLHEFPLKLGALADIFVGLQTSADDVFILEYLGDSGDYYRLKSRALGTVELLEKDLLFPLISGTDVNRYAVLPERQYILFPYAFDGGRVSLIGFGSMSNNYPRISNYFERNRRRLQLRENGRMKNERWYGYIYLKNMAKQSLEKLCVPRLINSLYATYDVSGTHFLDNVDVGGITLKPEYASYGAHFILALLNSRLLRWFFPQISAPFRGGYMSANRQFLSQLAMPTLDFNKTRELALHKELTDLSKKMLDMHRRVASSKLEAERNTFFRLIERTDQDIDLRVYELYCLTPADIDTIESATIPMKYMA